MAVDSAAKRLSFLNFSDGVQVPFLPDGTVGAGDRAHMLDLYSGLAAAEGGGGQGMIVLGRATGVESSIRGTKIVLRGGRL